MKIIKNAIGLHGRNDRDDVVRLERLLHQAGYLDIDKTDGPTGWYGMRVAEATKAFQKDNGLKRDGVLKPDGETEKRLVHVASNSDDAYFPDITESPTGNLNIANPDDAYFSDKSQGRKGRRPSLLDVFVDAVASPPPEPSKIYDRSKEIRARSGAAPIGKGGKFDPRAPTPEVPSQGVKGVPPSRLPKATGGPGGRKGGIVGGGPLRRRRPRPEDFWM